MLRIVILIVLIVIVVLAFSRDWVTFNWTTKNEEKSEATVTFDREKLKEDIGTAEKKTREALGIKSSTIRGTVESVKGNQLEVRTGDRNLVTVRLTPETAYRKAAEPAAAADVQVGQQVLVEMKQDEAKSVTLDPK
jgi:hypothetical protein